LLELHALLGGRVLVADEAAAESDDVQTARALNRVKARVQIFKRELRACRPRHRQRRND
jgi:hypothetical protein